MAGCPMSVHAPFQRLVHKQVFPQEGMSLQALWGSRVGPHPGSKVTVIFSNAGATAHRFDAFGSSIALVRDFGSGAVKLYDSARQLVCEGQNEADAMLNSFASRMNTSFYVEVRTSISNCVILITQSESGRLQKPPK